MSKSNCCNPETSSINLEDVHTYGETPTKVSVTIAGCVECIQFKDINEPIELVAVYLSDNTVVTLNWWSLFDIVDTYTSSDVNGKLLFKPLTVITFDNQGMPETTVLKDSSVTNF